MKDAGSCTIVLVNKAGYPFLFVEGVERYVFELFKILLKIGLRVLLVSKFVFKDTFKQIGGSILLNASLPLWHVSNEDSLLRGVHYILGTLVYCFRTFSAALHNGARIVHVNDGLVALIMSLLSRISCRRFLVVGTIHAPPPWILAYGRNHLLIKLGYVSLYLLGIILADKIVLVNPYTCLALKHYQPQCTFIPNAVSENFCRIDEKLIRKVLKEYNIDRKYFLFVSRLVSEKGLDRLFKVLRHYRKLGGESQLIIVGKGTLECYVDKLKKIDSRVIHLRHVPRNHLKALYRNALALIVTSYAEGMPTTVLEALACNTPIVLYTEKEIANAIKNALKTEDATNQIVIVTNALEAAKALSNNMDKIIINILNTYKELFINPKINIKITVN